MFIVWEAVVLGASGGGGAGGGGDPVAALRAAGPVAAALVDAFTLLAVATSFIGFCLGLSQFVAEALGLPSDSKLLPCALVLLPPTALATLDPNIFFRALDFAGTYGVMVLFGLVPAAMAAAGRRGGGGRFRVLPGGAAALAAVALAAGAVIADQASRDLAAALGGQ
jgi:tyrosine-specific transport protein